MIRHTVLFRWKAEATEDDKQQVANEVAKLPSMVPSIRAFASGADAGVAEGNYDFAVTADFEDLPGFFEYRDDPGHREIIKRYIVPLAASRVAVQFEF
jgi:hypothetical protein